jgi:hypothetical protein
MQYGLDSRVFTIPTTDGDILRYCIPMDNQRPGLDLKHFKDICPDKNGASVSTFLTVFNASFEVPVIGVFTKYDQFQRNIKMHLQDHPNENPDGGAADVADRRFQDDYLRPLGVGARFVRVESVFRVKCFGYVLMFFC